MDLAESGVETEGNLVMQAAGIERLRCVAVESDAAIFHFIAAPIVADDRGVAIAVDATFTQQVLPVENGIGSIKQDLALSASYL